MFTTMYNGKSKVALKNKLHVASVFNITQSQLAFILTNDPNTANQREQQVLD